MRMYVNVEHENTKTKWSISTFAEDKLMEAVSGEGILSKNDARDVFNDQSFFFFFSLNLSLRKWSLFLSHQLTSTVNSHNKHLIVFSKYYVIYLLLR